MVSKTKESTQNLIKDFDEGLGTVYERFRLNYIFQRYLNTFQISKILEYPIYGMTGVDGINSVYFARQNKQVELVDCDAARLKQVEHYWNLLGLSNNLKLHYQPFEKMADLILPAGSFDLVWNFAALWFYRTAEEIIEQMINLSGNLVMISVNNAWQIGYPLRKYLLDKEFFTKNEIQTEWINLNRIKSILRTRGLEIIEEGVFDTPPWPDTCLPVNQIKRKLGLKVEENETSDWLWSMMAWYAGADPELEARVKKFMFIEDSPLPPWLKQFWSHHRYVIAQKK
jgi:hypothetical protein